MLTSNLTLQVIDNIGFRNYLELLPELRELIYDFYASRYSTCLAALERCVSFVPCTHVAQV